LLLLRSLYAVNSQANRARESKAVDAGRLSLSLAMALPFTVAGFLAQQETKRAGRKTLDKTVVGSFVGSFVSVAPLSFSLSF
jgi:hypothetical protein